LHILKKTLTLFLGNALAVILLFNDSKRTPDSQVYILRPSGEKYMIQQNKKGPVHSLTWNPNGKYFALSQGYSPANVRF